MERKPIRVLSLVLALALVLTACSSEQTTTTTAGQDTTTTTAAPGTTAAPADTTTTEPASTEPIKIGALTSLNGNFTPWGVSVVDGMQLAVNELNDAGGVDGRMLELVVADDESNADVGVTALERLIERDGVVAAGGVISSDVGVNASRVAEELEVPLFLVKAGSDAILTRDSRYTFRTCLPSAPMTMAPLQQYAASVGITSVGAIIADYAWGQAIKSALENSVGTDPNIELQVEVAPPGEREFTTYLRSLEGLNPEIIAVTGHPPGSGAITAQSADLGFDVPIIGAWTPLSLIMGGLAETAIGRYADFKCVDHDSESYQELARRYLEFSDNTFMEDDAVAGYGIVLMVAEAVGAVGDDPKAVAEYLHANTFELPGYAFDMAWTEWGEFANAQISVVILSEGPAPEGTNTGGDWWVETLFISDPLEPFEP